MKEEVVRDEYEDEEEEERRWWRIRQGVTESWKKEGGHKWRCRIGRGR